MPRPSSQGLLGARAGTAGVLHWWLRVSTVSALCVLAISAPVVWRFPGLEMSTQGIAAVGLTVVGFPALMAAAARLDQRRGSAQWQMHARGISGPGKIGLLAWRLLVGWERVEIDGVGPGVRLFLQPWVGAHEREVPLPPDPSDAARLISALANHAPGQRPASWRPPPAPWSLPRKHWWWVGALSVLVGLATGFLGSPTGPLGPLGLGGLPILGVLLLGPGIPAVWALAPRDQPLGARLPVAFGVNLVGLIGLLYGLIMSVPPA